VAAIAVVLAVAYRVARNRWAANSQPSGSATEPRSRKVLRIGFGVLWIFDGLLQAQPRMAGGLSSQVIEPIASASPGWVQNVVNFGGTIWTYQSGAGRRGGGVDPDRARRVADRLGDRLVVAAGRLASAGWGLVVWVFGEAFGGVFAPGLTWLSGAPGAVLIYLVVGALIALPLRAWAGPRLGRLLLAGTGVFWVGMALLQTLPANGFWHGGGTLTGMVSSMANVTQPHAQAAMLSAFASFTTSQAFAVNLFVVIALAGLGAVFISGRQRLLRVAVPVATVFCLVVWVLVQDLGFPGGLGNRSEQHGPLDAAAVGWLFRGHRTNNGDRGRRKPGPGHGAAPHGTAPGIGRGGEPAVAGRAGRGRRHHPRRGPDGGGFGGSQRGSDHRAGHRGRAGAAGPSGTGLPAHQRRVRSAGQSRLAAPGRWCC